MHQVALRLVCDVRDGDGGGPSADGRGDGEGELDAQREHPKLGRKFHSPTQPKPKVGWAEIHTGNQAFVHPLSLAIARAIRLII